MLDFKKLELFKNFSDNILSKLSQYVFEKDYDENEIIFKEGDPGDSLCIVEQGEVAIRRLVDKNQTKRKTLAIIEKGDFQKLTNECKKALEIIKKYIKQ